MTSALFPPPVLSPLQSVDWGMILTEIATLGGERILQMQAQGIIFFQKPDGTQCSNADHAAQETVVAALNAAFPHIPVIAEEQLEHPKHEMETYFLVDPLDGTSAFLQGRPEYAVNIALMHQNKPVYGVICAPALGRIWWGGIITGKAAAYAADINPQTREIIRTIPLLENKVVDGAVRALTSRRHGYGRSDLFLRHLNIRMRTALSSSIKFGLIASGEADVYVRFGPTMTWDTASGQAILEAVGGSITTVGGDIFSYPHPADLPETGFLNPPFVAWGDAQFAQQFFKDTPADW
jgi:3'(2'), 5'-bisphosphate nucleotidase